MANDLHRVLWCLIQDDSNPFEVTAPVDASIGRLKELIWEKRKNGVLRGSDAADLALWKVRTKRLADSSLLTSRSLTKRSPYSRHRVLLGALHLEIYRNVRSSCRILAKQCWTSSWKSLQLGAFT